VIRFDADRSGGIDGMDEIKMEDEMMTMMKAVGMGCEGLK
jgi:hypothetical protein